MRWPRDVIFGLIAWLVVFYVAFVIAYLLKL